MTVPRRRPLPPVRAWAAAARRAFAIAVVASTSLAAGCGRDPATAPGGAPPAAPPKSEPPVRPVAAAPAVPLPTFVEISDEAGLIVTNHTGKPEQKDWIVSAMGGGAIALDHDNDGDMDLVVVDGTMLTEAGDLEYDDAWRTRLFRNDGGMKFTDVTKQAGIDIQAFGFGGAACDFDADGDADFYVCCWGRNYLMRNRGDGTFEDVTAAAGLLGGEHDMSTACSWGDVDGDGVHDLYVANYCDQRAFIEKCKKKGMPGRHATWREFKVYVGPAGIDGQNDRLYLGKGDGTFREVTATNLLEQRALFGFQSVMSDIDNDGDLDIFVANDTHSNHLWINDGKGVFRDKATAAACAMSQDMMEQAGMGADAGDFNADGWMDLTVTNFSHDYNTIYLNRTGRSGVVAFTDSSNVLGIGTASYHRLCWGVKFVDYDNDTWLDHMVACGHVYGEMQGFEKTTGTSYRQRCQMLRNPGPPTFRLTDVTDVSGPAFEVKRVWRGISFADFDDDGDTDMYVAALNDRAGLFRNDGGNRNSFVRFRLVGKGGQRDPSGARVSYVHPDGKVRMLELHHGSSFCCDNDPRLLFGTGSLTSIGEVEVRWPGGQVEKFKDVATRRAYVVEQGAGELRPDRLDLR